MTNAWSVRDLNILYEDDHVMVIYKPVGLVVHGGEGVKEPVTLSDVLMGYYPPIASVGEQGRPGIVHRLDKDTDGVMVVAKTGTAYEFFKEAFKQRCIQKRYYAMVRGDVLEDERFLDYPIQRQNGKKKVRIVPEHFDYARSAQTIVKVLKRYRSKTLCDVRPITGRMHQIRIHMAHIGHPIMGDGVYGTVKPRYPHLLQAYFLSFSHPVSGMVLNFELPMSSRFYLK